MGAELTRCCGVDDPYYEHLPNTTKKGEEDEERDNERKKIKRKLKTILVHKDPEFAKYIKTEKYERLQNISPSKEEALLTAFAKNELTKEITWDILLAIASKKYGEMELIRLRSKKSLKRKPSLSATTIKQQTPQNENGNNDDYKDSEKEEKYNYNDNNNNNNNNNNDDGQNTSDTDKTDESINDNNNNNNNNSNNNKNDIEKYKNLRDENEMLPLSTLSFRFPWNNLYKFIRPSSLQELESEMQRAVDKNQKIKAMGSRYAWTNVTFTDGLCIDIYNSLNKPKLQIDNNCFNKYGKDLYGQNNLLLCEAGANIKEIHELLWPKGRRRFLVNKQQKPYKMIPDIPGYDDLCIGGLIQSGGYGLGTPYHYGSFVNHIRSFCMLIVDDKKKVRKIQVEPSPENGAIHDAYKWCRKYPNIQLIQNDSIFHALLVSLGSCGVIYSVFIELMDAHYLYEKRYMMSWKQFKHKKWKSIDKKCKNGDIVRLQLYISPYLTYDKKYRESPPVIINTYEYTEEMPMHNITEKDGGHHRSRDCERSTILASLLATRFANKWPRLVPFILQMSMESTCHSGIAISAADAILYGNYNIIPTHKSGFGMNASSFTAIGDDYVRLCNILRAKCSKQIITQPVALRFSNPGFGLLNFTYNESSVILEQSLYDFRQSIYFENEAKINDDNDNNNNNNNNNEQLQVCTSTTPKLWHTLFKLQELCMGEKYKGKPHLGLYFHVDENIWKNHGQQFKEFVQIYKKFNPHKTFCNAFTKESGLDKYAGFV